MRCNRDRTLCKVISFSNHSKLQIHPDMIKGIQNKKISPLQTTLSLPFTSDDQTTEGQQITGDNCYLSPG